MSKRVFQNVWFGEPALIGPEYPTREMLGESPGREKRIYLFTISLTYSHQYFCLCFLASDLGFVLLFKWQSLCSLARVQGSNLHHYLLKCTDFPNIPPSSSPNKSHRQPPNKIIFQSLWLLPSSFKHTCQRKITGDSCCSKQFMRKSICISQ